MLNLTKVVFYMLYLSSVSSYDLNCRMCLPNFCRSFMGAILLRCLYMQVKTKSNRSNITSDTINSTEGHVH